MNNDQARDAETRKSTSRYAFHLGNDAISSLKKQSIVTFSTVEA